MPPKKVAKNKGVDKKGKQNEKGPEKSGTDKKKIGTKPEKCKAYDRSDSDQQLFATSTLAVIR